MATVEYTWKIERLDCYPTLESFADVVSTVHWRLLAVGGGGCEATAYGTVTLDVSTVEEDFTPYAELTEAQVVGWVTAAIDGAKYEALLAQNIADQLSPPIVSPPLPWTPPPTPEPEPEPEA